MLPNYVEPFTAPYQLLHNRNINQITSPIVDNSVRGHSVPDQNESPEPLLPEPELPSTCALLYNRHITHISLPL